MTKRYRIELTNAELRALDALACFGTALLDADDQAKRNFGMNSPAMHRAAYRAMDKLLAALVGSPRASASIAFPPSFLDGSHDPERADCACDWCAEGRAPAGELEMDDVSRPGLPMDWRER